MGRSKFPGKPSKLVNKKRVSVLQVSENNLINYDNDEYLSNDQISLWNHENETTTFVHDGDDVQDHPVSKAREKPPSSEPPDGGGKHKYSSTRNFNTGVVTRARNTSQHLQNSSSSTALTSSSSATILNTPSTSTISSSSYLINKPDGSSKRDKSSASTEKPVKKKTVTFKNVLETSDDASAVRKVYNPDNAPLVSIIKKECLSRSVRLVRSDCIVRPSRLTEILKNNANNIDKLNFLKFRSSFPKEMETTVPSVTSITTGTTTSGTTTTTASPTLTTMAPAPSNSNESSSNNVTVGDKRFILPKRSAHSCRVIKPNKRFLVDVEMPTKSTKKTTLPKDGGVGTTKRQLKKTFNNQQQQFNDVENGEDKNSQKISRTSGNSGPGSLQQDSFINNTLSHQINSSKLIEDNRSDENDDTSETSLAGTDDTQTDSTEAEEDELESNKISRMHINNAFTTGSMSMVKSIFNSASASKVILRQPRLQYDSQSVYNPHPSSCNTLSSSPFSLNLSCNVAGASPLTLGNSNICGVCGTAINSKVFPQSRKYGIFSCEACRKFISKTIKKLASASGSPQSVNMLQCNKGDGSCVISPLHKGSIKNFKKTYKERCAACWLKKCTKSFHVPSGFKNRLNSIIPASIRDNESNALAPLTSFSIKKENLSTVIITTTTTSSTTTASPSVTTSSISPLESETAPMKSGISNSNLFASPPGKLISWSAESFGDSVADKTLPLTNPLAENNTTFGGSPLIKPTILEKPVFLLNTAVCSTESAEAAIKPKTLDTSKQTMIHSSQIKHSIEAADESLTNVNKIKLRRKEKDSLAQTQPIGCDPPKRQRIDLKGPRVKHVCRSASIVLGQPIATFANESSTALDSMDTPPRPESPNNAEVELTNAILNNQSTINCSTCTQENNAEQELGLSPPATPVDDNRAQDESSNEIGDKIDTMDNTNSSNSSSNGEKENKKTEDQVPKPLTRKISRPALTASNNVINTTNPRNLNSFSKKLISEQTTPQKINVPPKISIDFWENYDPAEVCQTGFGIIVTESIPMRALCFLCGSTGLDPLIFCACCCEPYHSYCVEDEYNLKHSSLDDTMTSLADASINPIENVSIITNRLNWLCPRCTVCYTCNMSSGSKVKCQKCQKNYHTTCLGTSKRLSGADRPLICANCLKCKSCSTTKVTKFVGNLPMCSQCFKLRKKGNFCPLCQKCYEDNDFDLKMMECGDCQRWVHAKCEGLSDEQYNLLSTLPENIEFICRKCSKANNQANLWRDAVAAEFKSGLLSVVKLLSKSRQACALLKLSPRKKSSANCTCQPQSIAARNLQFKKHDVHELNLSNDSKGTTDEESQNSEDINMNEDVYEFKENLPGKCFCGANQKQLTSLSVPNLVEIKRKINFGDYVSLAEFNYDMNNVITMANCDELMIAYKEILSEAFPWFQNETKACTDALEEDMFDSCTFSQPNDGVECDQQVPVIDLPEDIEDCLYSPNKNDDRRVCMFCKGIGEGEANQESRFLYCGQNSWVHINCAMWSAEVFEEIDGSLQNVHSAISRGRLIKCSSCGNRGATVGCNVKSCGEHYHYPCAKKSNCAFMTDKTVYCPIHLSEANKKQANIEKSFEVLRPVYVELDRKKKKLVEPSKVKFLIGSLEVKKLGKVFPKLSDTNEAIIPVDFLCTRLYWSIKEPWKIVEYTVKTTIQNNMLSYACDNGRNFTVDHSGSTNKVQLGMTQIARWHNSLLLGEENESGFFRQERSVKQILEAVGQSGNTEEGTEEEPQNNADLLPPEIKDAIFEDLPHELLDGISMLDIFPKLMIYEDMIAIDNKTEGYYTNEYTKDGTISDEDGNDAPSQKDLELSNGWPISSGVSHVEDAMLSAVRPLGNTREIKRSKSEVFPRSIGGNRSQQRSSSLTWSCKLENTSSAAAVKRRKISKGFSDIRLSEGVLLSIGRRKDEFPAGIDRRRISQSEDCRTKQFTWSAAKKYTQNDIQDYASISRDTSDKLKISQLDGMDDITNESDYGEFQQLQSVYDPNSTESPVKCDRCNCTYRTHDSYQRHLATCEPLSTSESESETAPRSPDMRSPLIQATHHPLSMMQNFGAASLPITSIPNTQIMTSTNGIQTIGSTTTSIPTIQNVQIQNGIPMTQINQGISNIFLTTTQNSTQQQTSHQAMTPTVQQQQFLPTLQNLSQTVNSINQFTTVSNPTVSSTQTISISTNGIHQSQQQPQLLTMSTADGNQHVLTIGSQQATNLLNVHHNRTIGHTSLFQKPQIVRAQVERAQAKVRQLNKIQQSPNKVKTKPTNAAKPIQMKRSVTAIQQKTETANIAQPVQIMNQNIPGLVRNQTDNNQGIVLQQNTNSQPIIVQQVGNTSNNLVSYVTAADGHNSVQYVAVPASNDFKQPQTPFLTNPLMQGTFLQTDSSGNLVLTNASSGLQMLSAAPLQITQPTQPQVIGTLIQPQTAAIQCGVMSAEQMVLGSTPTLEMVTNPTMLLTSQPVYYGLETIVQNTVMSSQQFVSTAMQGVLSQNASFSATTTQVFQASKIEPIMEMPAGYVVLNNVDGTIMQQPTTQANIISTNVLQQPSIQQIHAQPQQIHAQTVQQQQINPQSIQSIYNIQQQTPQVQSQNILQHQPTITTAAQPTIQTHHMQPQLRAVSPAKPTAKSSPIVVTKIQPQIINKVVPNMSVASTAANIANQQHTVQEQQKLGNQIILSKSIAISAASVDTNPRFIQTTATGAIAKGVKSSPVSMSHHHPLKPKTNSTNMNASLMPIQPVQRKMNMIRPLNKVMSSSASSTSPAVTIKPKVMTKPVSNKLTGNGKSNLHSPPLIAPKPQQMTLNMQNNKLQQQQVVSRNGGAGGIGQVINEQQLLDARKNLQAQLAQADSTAEIMEPANDTLNGILVSQAMSPTVNDDIGTQANNLANIDPPPAQDVILNGQNVYPQNNFQYSVTSINQTQTINLPTSSSSIQLPSAPFVSPYGNNIPTNIVNPIQQVNNNNNNNNNNPSNVISRPTNRVLPMQTIQNKLLSPPTPPEPKLSISKREDKDMEQRKKLKEIVSSTLSSSNPQFDLIEKEHMASIQQQSPSLVRPSDGCQTPIIHRHTDDEGEKIISIEVRINNEVITLDSAKNNSELKMILNDPHSEEENEFDMKPDSDGIPDQDDMSDGTTPEVKEKICEILENLENEECNRSSILGENFNTNESIVESNKDTSETDLMDQQKENVDPMQPETVNNLKTDSISPIKVSDFMGIHHTQCQGQQLTNQKTSGPRLLYEIQSEDGFTYKSTSIMEVWEKVFEAVQVARKAHGLSPLPEGPLADMCGVQMLGLKTNALRYLIEQLPGVERCSKYTPKYHKRKEQNVHDYSSDQEDLKENPFGSARCESFSKRSDYDMFSWLASRHRKQPIHVIIQPPDNELIPRRGTGSNLPMAMKYRTLKETYKDYVGVFRSHIHGRGLYCTKDIEAGEMVIEYAGELIRSTLTDKRERYYDSKGIGCYMFKIDENLVVDATMRGNAARFINHSCEPNCYSKVVDILGHKHIIIFALRRIVQGEELTYDYKFPFEDVKIPCSCGSKKCRKYLN